MRRPVWVRSVEGLLRRRDRGPAGSWGLGWSSGPKSRPQTPLWGPRGVQTDFPALRLDGPSRSDGAGSHPNTERGRPGGSSRRSEGRGAQRPGTGGRSASGKRGCSGTCCWQAADRGRQTEPRCQQHPHWVPRPKAPLAAGTEAAGGARGGTGGGGGARSPGTGSAAPQKRGERWGAAGRGLRRFPGGGIAPRLSAPELPSGEGRLVTQSATRVVPSGGPRGCRRRTVHPRQGRGTGVCVGGGQSKKEPNMW